MTDHAYVQHPVWTTRDQCEYVSPDQETNAICGMPRSAHATATCDVCGRPSVGIGGSDVPGKPIDEVCFRVKAGADTTCYEVGYRREKAKADGLRASVLRLLRDGRGPGGGQYEPDQRLAAAVALLEVGWGG